MKNCREITRLLSEAQERELSLSERMGLRMHLAMCRGCRNFAEQMATLRKICRAYARRDEGNSGRE
ncbi:zf-HC2 domain-containing protein [Microbulbifer guangxiensis]|uniref:zf-HC2 domain-containing protein n=1 Tax=Microbulbifer guangxiensis TaxID=2904249 RepID=UPI001F20C1BD